MDDEKTPDIQLMEIEIIDESDNGWDDDIILDEPTIEDFKATIEELTALDIHNDRDSIIDIFPEVEIYLRSIIPHFRCSEARNGMVKIKINNFNQLCEFKYVISDDDWLSPAFSTLCMFRIGCLFKHNQSSSIIYIERGHIHDEGELFIKFPTYYTSYNVDIWLQANNDIFDTYSEPQLPSKYSFLWPKSDIFTLHIPSFLSYDEYKVNETIGIPMISRDTKEVFLANGKITAILHDNRYEIGYNGYNDDEKRIIIPISKLYPKRAYQVVNLGRVLNKDIYRNKYIEIDNKSQFDFIVNVLWNYFEYNRRCGEPLQYSSFPDYSQSMEYFIIQNICQFLFKFQYHYKIDCIINGFDGKLRFGNIIHLRTEYLGIQYLVCWCDCCGVELNEYDFVFSCVGKQRQHLICIDCINTTIESNLEIKKLIHSILLNELNIDCIGKIVEFAIGRVIYT